MSSGQTSPASFRRRRLTVYFVSSSIGLLTPMHSLADTESGVGNAAEKSDIASDERVLQEIIVDGSYLKGSALSEYEPELVLTESDIAAYGVSSIGELLSIIEVETSSGKQRRSEPPVVLINGRRVSGFRELDNYPVESLARVEVLPEEASLAYGFTANQRVINFVLKSDLRIIPINTRTQAPVGGGTLSNTVDASRVVIDGNDRTTVRGKVSESSPLTERERDIIPFVLEQPRIARSLVPASDLFELSGLKTISLPDNAIATFSGRFEQSESEFLTGLSAIDGEQLSQLAQSQTLDLGVTINSKLAANTWSVVGTYSQTDREVENRGTVGFEVLPVETSVRLAKVDANVNVSLFQVPNGAVTLSGAIGGSSEAFKSSSDSISISRAAAYIQGALSYPLPIDETRWGRGTLSLDRRQSTLSDQGNLSDYGVSANWIPIEGVTLTASWASEDIAPTLQEFALPQTLSINRSFFDLTRSETVTATLLDGGNADLKVASREISKLGLVWKPWEKRELTFSTNYVLSEEQCIFSRR
ncbi:MAG: TonB-dependent receptor [Pseudomonadota bacterium]